MGSKSNASAALFLALSLLFISLVTANTCSCTTPTPKSPPKPPKSPPPPKPPKSPPPPKKNPPPPTPSCPPPPTPTPPTPPTPTPPSTDTCPIDILKLGVCGNLLGGLVGIIVGTPSNSPCCTLLQGIADLDAAVCLCTAIKANVLGLNLDIPISISLLLNDCGKKVPSGFQCK